MNVAPARGDANPKRSTCLPVRLQAVSCRCMTATTTLAVKVSRNFARKYREFCESNCLQVGKFTESALGEVMEDYYFGRKAQRILSKTSGPIVAHESHFGRRRSRRRRCS